MVQFTLEPASGPNLIRGYSARAIVIGERRLTRSLIVSAERVVSEWEPASFADLAVEHLDAVFALDPELVVLGSGPTQRFATPAVRAAFAAHRIGLEVMELGAACRTYNVLVQEGRRPVAGLFLS